MKWNFLLPTIFLAVLLSACQVQASPVIEQATPTPEWERAGWALVWQDEFSGDAIDSNKWGFDIGGHGWGNNEGQFYSDRTDNARLENGMLVIEAREEKFIRRNYTSARLKTQGLFAWTYGRVEARMRLPYGNGIWPAFWMLGTDISEVGWPASGEIDIMEFIGREPDRVYGTVHGPGYSGGSGVGHYHNFQPGELKDNFHVFAIEWEPEEIRWYVDEVQFFKITPESLPGKWVYDHPFFIILNLAVGGSWPGYPDESTVFPQFLYVDYVRIYQRPDQITTSLSGGPVHIGDIGVEARPSEDEWRASAAVLIVDADGAPVEGAKVSGGWVGIVIRGETNAFTDTSGMAYFLSDPTEKQGEVTFCVTSVTGQNYSYDKSANVRNCAKIIK
jgi:beta-glucanase (GH16 family)